MVKGLRENLPALRARLFWRLTNTKEKGFFNKFVRCLVLVFFFGIFGTAKMNVRTTKRELSVSLCLFVFEFVY